MTDNVCTASPHSACEIGCDEYSSHAAVCVKMSWDTFSVMTFHEFMIFESP